MEGQKLEIPCPFDEDSQLRLVLYRCSCGHSQPLCRLYFCRYCSELRCGYCVSHEVDSHYCPNCLESMPSAEARLKKNRCANCFDCPSCANTLSTRATSTSVPSPDDPSSVVAKKAYYLACGFCRWTTRDIGLPDQPMASGGWPEPENPDCARFAALQDHYRYLAQREKVEKETRRFIGKKLSYMQLADKYGVVASRRKAGLPPLQSWSLRGPSGEDGKGATASASEAKCIEEVEDVDYKELFATAVDLCRTTRLSQRLTQLDTQPEKASDVYPRHKHLVVKRSQRCRCCEHNLSKPEHNPTSIKFKIQLAAFYHVPDVVIFQLSEEGKPPKAGAETTFVLKLTNPSQHPTQVELVDLDEHWAEKKRKEEEEEEEESKGESSTEEAKDEAPSSMTLAALTRQFSMVKAAECHEVAPNARFLPSAAAGTRVHLPARDDTAEYDETGPDLTGVVDDERLVVWRKSNKAGIRAGARLDDDVEPGTEVVVGFALKYGYTNTLPSPEQKEAPKYDVSFPVYVVLGKAE